ncbi:MAG TPA: hypothetical protein VJO53_00115 [Candidatus Acidoferrales bacterium]|nr:hypothetical protein [Candidatus Acidoferrales bacterium]
MGAARPPLGYLETCSEAALESMELSRLNRAANLRKELREILEDWIESEVDARMARWLLEYRRAHAEQPGDFQTESRALAPGEQLAISFLPAADEKEPRAELAAVPSIEPRGNVAAPSLARARVFASKLLPARWQKSDGASPAELSGPDSSSSASSAPRPEAPGRSERSALREVEHLARGGAKFLRSSLGGRPVRDGRASRQDRAIRGMNSCERARDATAPGAAAIDSACGAA